MQGVDVREITTSAAKAKFDYGMALLEVMEGAIPSGHQLCVCGHLGMDHRQGQCSWKGCDCSGFKVNEIETNKRSFNTV